MPFSMAGELWFALFTKSPDAFRVVVAIVYDTPQTLDTFKTSRAHRMSAGEHA